MQSEASQEALGWTANGWEFKAWDRLPNESQKAHAAAKVYFDLGPSRTIAAAAAVHRKGPEGPARGPKRPGGCPVYIKAWAKKHNWEKRAQAYDQALDDRVFQARAEAREAWAKQREERRLIVDKDAWMIAEQIKYRALQLIEWRDNAEKTGATTADGQPIDKLVLIALFREGVKALIAADRLARLSVGMPLTYTDVRAKVIETTEEPERPLPAGLAGALNHAAAKYALEQLGLPIPELGDL